MPATRVALCRFDSYNGILIAAMFKTSVHSHQSLLLLALLLLDRLVADKHTLLVAAKRTTRSAVLKGGVREGRQRPARNQGLTPCTSADPPILPAELTKAPADATP